MATKTVRITLTVVGTNIAPKFDIYDDVDPLTVRCADVDTADLQVGYDCVNIDENATQVILVNIGGVCDDPYTIPIVECTTTTTSSTSSTTTTTTTIPPTTTTTSTTCADAVLSVTGNTVVEPYQTLVFEVTNISGQDEAMRIYVLDAGNHGLIFELYESGNPAPIHSGLLTLNDTYDDMTLPMDGLTNKEFTMIIEARPKLGLENNCVEGSIYLFECDGVTPNINQYADFDVCDEAPI